MWVECRKAVCLVEGCSTKFKIECEYVRVLQVSEKRESVIVSALD